MTIFFRRLCACLALFLLLSAPFPAFAVGAIAVDDDAGRSAREVGYGYSTRFPNRASAERDALRRCRDATRSNCRVVVWFESCGAYATSRGHSGIGYGTSERSAVRGAMDACGDRGCHLVVSACE